MAYVIHQVSYMLDMSKWANASSEPPARPTAASSHPPRSWAPTHPNVYIGSDAHNPRNWKPEFVHFINTWGRNKVIFGTDFPVVDFERAMKEIAELGLRPGSERLFLRESALRIYGLEG